MANITQPEIQINYISELKKCFINRNNGPISQMFKIDSRVTDTYYFQIISKNNQIVSLKNRTFEIYGSFIDNRNQLHVLFFTNYGSVNENTLIFTLDTYTDEYMTYVQNQKQINITIVETTRGMSQVVLRDLAIAYERPYIDGKEVKEVIYRDVLTGSIPFSGEFGSGFDINLTENTNGAAFGYSLYQNGDNQLVIGQYNVPDATKSFIIGNGESDQQRSNIFSIDYQGNITTSGGITITSGFIGEDRILTTTDRVNISELNNDVGFITEADLPSGGGGGTEYFAGSGIIIDEENTISVDNGYVATKGDVEDVENNINDISGIVTGIVTDLNDVSGSVNEISGSLSNYAPLTAIPTSTSQLTNDNNFVTSSSLNTYAPLTAIPTSASQLINDGVYINWLIGANGVTVERSGFQEPYGREWFIRGKYVDIVASGGLSSYVYDDAGEKTLYLSVDNSVFNNYATTGQLNAVSTAIPTSTSQLTNDNGLLSSLTVYDSSDSTFTGKMLKFGSEFTVYSPQQDVIEIDPNDMLYIDVTVGESSLGYQRAMTFSDEFQYNYNTGAIELARSNKESIYIDPYTYGSSEGVRYVSGYNIISTEVYLGGFDDVQPHPVSGATLDNGEVITFEHWMHSDISIAKIDINPNDNQIIIGDIPSTLPANTHTVVFTRRLVKANNTTQQFISYAYSF